MWYTEKKRERERESKIDGVERDNELIMIDR